jgi:hypothetical protein
MVEGHNAEVDAFAARLDVGGLLRILTRTDDDTDHQSTQRGARVARQLAVSDEAGRDALMDARLGVGPSGP